VSALSFGAWVSVAAAVTTVTVTTAATVAVMAATTVATVMTVPGAAKNRTPLW